MIYVIDYGDYDYVIEQGYYDILEYEFYKKFNEFYVLGGFHTPEQSDFLREFDRAWFHNDIHESDYYTTRNYDFLSWLKDKYEEDAHELFSKTNFDCADDWWDSLDADEKDCIWWSYCEN